MKTSFYTEDELKELGFKSIGENVKISRKASIYEEKDIVIGSDVRIDDFCLLSGKITLGNHVHIAAYSALWGGQTGIEMKDFSGLSSKCSIYAESDDYSGKTLTNPTIPNQYLGLHTGKVILEKHVVVGAGTVVLPGITIGEGSAVGSMSLVNKNLAEWGIYGGIPCKLLKPRSTEMLSLETQVLEGQASEI